MSNSRSPICREIGKNDMIGVVIVALIAIVVGIYNLYLATDELSLLNSDEWLEQVEICEEVLEYENEFDRETIDIAEDILAMDSFCRKVDTIELFLYGGIIAIAVLMLLRLRIAFKLQLVLYILATISCVVYQVFSLIHGSIDEAADTVGGTIFVIIVRIGVIKMLIGLVISTSAGASAPAAAPYVAPVGNVPLTPTERNVPTIDPVTGQQHTATMPAMLQKNPQPVHTGASMEAVVPPSAVPQSAPVSAQPAPAVPSTAPEAVVQEDWQCKGCGFMNAGKNEFCSFCGTKKS